MLSQKQKDALRYAFQKMSCMPGMLDRIRKIGPARVVDFIAANSRHDSTRIELTENRDEAERLVAGLMGMM